MNERSGPHPKRLSIPSIGALVLIWSQSCCALHSGLAVRFETRPVFEAVRCPVCHHTSSFGFFQIFLSKQHFVSIMTFSRGTEENNNNK